MGKLQDKIAIVTGGGQGIGAGIARRFAAEGATVVVAQRSAEPAEELVGELESGGAQACWIRTDVRSAEEVQRLVADVLSRFGQVDILCNNAGVSLSRTVVDTSDEEYALLMETNVRGVFNCCRAALSPMLRQRSGSIVNVASIAGYLALPGEAIYSATKGAVIALTRQMALEYAASGVRVNAICPSFISGPALDRWIARQPDASAAIQSLNDFHPMGRVGTQADAGAAAAFLASDDAAFITGVCLAVDGGVAIKA